MDEPPPIPAPSAPGQSAPEPGLLPPSASVIPESLAALAGSPLIGPPTRPGLLGVVDGFELHRVLGRGGMGIVFLARSVEGGKEVALKMLRPEFASQAAVMHRFLLEARHQQKLKHPNIVPVLEVREMAQGAFFTMPHFERGSLAQRLQSGTPLTQEETATIAGGIGKALQFAHTKGITHRDIKPANVLLGADGSVCLADFGLARTVFNDSVIDVERSQFEGTPAYMSPAVAAGQAEDTRCDIYGFGALLYEMLTGRAPYQGPNVAEIRRRIVEGPPEPIRKLNAKADGRLVEVAESAMAREHRDRYASMADVVEDLERVGAGAQPLGPHRPWRPLAALAAVPKATWLGGAALVVGALAWLLLWPHPKLELVGSFGSSQVGTWCSATPFEQDGVPGKELAVIDLSERLAWFTASGDFIHGWSVRLPEARVSRGITATDIQGDGRQEILVSWTQGTNLGISIVNDHPAEIRRLQALGPAPDPTNAGITAALLPLGLLPSDGRTNEPRKLLARVATAYGGGLRALCCFDLDTLVMDWRQNTGASLSDPVFIDLDGDGRKEIVLGSYACGNGVVGPDGSDDLRCYVFAFTDRGKLVWRTEISGELSTTQVLAVNAGTGVPPTVTAWVEVARTHHATHRSLRGKVVQLSPAGEMLGAYEPAVCFLSCVAADLDQDGRDEILCADCQGWVHVLGPDLGLRRKVRVFDPGSFRPGTFDCAEVRFVKAGHFARKDRIHVALWCCTRRQDEYNNPGYSGLKNDAMWFERSRILVLDSDLNPVAERRVADRSGAAGWVVLADDMDGDGLDEILSLRSNVEIFKLRER